MSEPEALLDEDVQLPIPLLGIGSRINSVCRMIGGRADAAAVAGVSDDMIRRYIRGESKPTFEVIVKLARAAGASLDWIAGDEDIPQAPAEQQLQQSTATLDTLGNPVDVSEFVFIPRYNVQAAAGHGQAVLDDAPAHTMAFRRYWIEVHLGANPADLSVLSVRGDSQQGVLNDRDVILIDRSQRSGSAGMYVLRLDGDLIVKTLQKLPGGMLEVSSTNPAYKPFEVNMDTPPADFAIIGRVVWFARRI